MTAIQPDTRTAAPAVTPLDAVGERDLSRVGGKAFRLGRARAAGFPVPEGFVVTAAAFRAWLETPSGEPPRPLGDRIQERLSAATDPRRVAEAAREVLALVLAAPLPPGLAEEARAGLAALARGGLEAPPVAVRSSALAEDGTARSLAGHFDSFLDVRGPEAVLDAVRRCFASAFSERMLAARLREGPSPAPHRGPGERPDEMAVLIQVMVRGGLGGVLFTQDPQGRAGRMLCEVSTEGAEGVAGGHATPHRAAIDRGNGRVVEGSTGARDEAALAAELAGLGTRLEEAFGGPQDVEWARGADGRVFLLQTRPIVAAARPQALDRWTAANSQEALEDPVTPLTYTFLEPWIERGRRAVMGVLGVGDPPGRYMRLFDGRIYFNVDYFRRFLERIPGAPTGVFDLLIFGELGEIELPRPPLSPRMLVVAREAWHAWSQAIPRMERFIGRLIRAARILSRRDIQGLSDEALLRHLERVSALSEQALRYHVLGTAMAGGHYLLLQKFLKRCGVPLEENTADELLAGAPGIETARSNAGIYELARLAGRLPAARAALLAERERPGLETLRGVEGGEVLLRALDRFLAEFGHRAEKEAELLRPRWREDPSFILRAVRHFLELGVGTPGEARLRSPLDVQESLKERGRRLARRVERALLGSGLLGGAKRALFRFLLSWAERAAPYRENLRFHALRGLLLAREALREVGRRLARRGAIPAKDDVFFLEAEEALRALSAGEGGPALAARALARREDYERWMRRADVPKLLYDDGTLAPLPERTERAARAGAVEPPPPVPEGVRVRLTLAGVAVSSGIVSGRVRRVERLEDGWSLQPDEILLARAATPSWTPLFFFARGVILDIGGMLSHCAVIAREYGIPCVVGLKTATADIEDGASVTVDAFHGRVHVHEAPPAGPA